MAEKICPSEQVNYPATEQALPAECSDSDSNDILSYSDSNESDSTEVPVSEAKHNTTTLPTKPHHQLQLQSAELSVDHEAVQVTRKELVKLKSHENNQKLQGIYKGEVLACENGHQHELTVWAETKLVPACCTLMEHCTAKDCDQELLWSDLVTIQTILKSICNNQKVDSGPVLHHAGMFGSHTIEILQSALSLLDPLLKGMSSSLTPREIVLVIQKISWKVDACLFFQSKRKHQAFKVHEAIFDCGPLSSSLGKMILKVTPPDLPNFQTIVEGPRAKTVSVPVSASTVKTAYHHIDSTQTGTILQPEFHRAATYSSGYAIDQAVQHFSLKNCTRKISFLSRHDAEKLGLKLNIEAGRVSPAEPHDLALTLSSTTPVVEVAEIETPNCTSLDLAELDAKQEASISGQSDTGKCHTELQLNIESEEQQSMFSHRWASLPAVNKLDYDVSSNNIVATRRHRRPCNTVNLPQKLGQTLNKAAGRTGSRKAVVTLPSEKRKLSNHFLQQQWTKIKPESFIEGDCSINFNRNVTRVPEEEGLVLISVTLDNSGVKDKNVWFRIEVSTTREDLFGQKEYTALRSFQHIKNLYTKLQSSPQKLPHSLRMDIAPDLSNVQNMRKIAENLLNYVASNPKLRSSQAFIDFLRYECAFTSSKDSQTTWELENTFFTNASPGGTVRRVHCKPHEQPSMSKPEEVGLHPFSMQAKTKACLRKRECHEGEMRIFTVEEDDQYVLIIGQEGSEYTLLAGTFEKLVDYLVWTYPQYILPFVLGYRHFVPAMDFLTLLTQRFLLTTSSSSSEEEVAFIEKWGYILQLRVLDILSCWITRCWLDFKENNPLLDKLQSFVSDLESTNDANLQLAAKTFDQVIKEKLQQKFVCKKITDPSSYSEDSLAISEHNAKQLARHLTLHNLQMLQAISLYELATYIWGNSKCHQHHSNLNSFIEHFDQVEHWVASTICSGKDPSIIEAFISVANHCFEAECKNMNTAMAIVHGLQHKAVEHLKWSWQFVRPESMKIFKRLTSIMSPEKHYFNYHTHCGNKTVPYIPSIHVFMEELKLLNRQNKSLKNGLLVFFKVTDMVSSFEELIRAQKSTYFFPIDHKVRKFCQGLKPASYYKELLLSASPAEPESNYQSPERPLSTSNPDKRELNEQLQDFQSVMVNLGSCLTSEDIRSISCFKDIPLSLTFPEVPPLVVMGHLYAKGLFTMDDTDALCDLLSQINRSDLIESIVRKYQQKYFDITSTKTIPSIGKESKQIKPTGKVIPTTHNQNQAVPEIHTCQHLYHTAADCVASMHESVAQGRSQDSSSVTHKPQTVTPNRVTDSRRSCSFEAIGMELDVSTTTWKDVVFLGSSDIVKFDSKGGVYHNSLHNVSLKVPEGAILKGVSLQIEVRVALYGPFIHPNDGRIVSPIVWLCVKKLEGMPESHTGTPFQKPVEVHLPHFFDCSDASDSKSLQFLKANHTSDSKVIDGKQWHDLKPVEDSRSVFIPGSHHGILFTKHFCYLCIQAKYIKEDFIAKTKFCVIGAMPDPLPKEWDLCFCVTYMVETCYQTAVHLFNKRFELQEYKTLWPVREFKFADSSTDAKLTIHMERDEPRLSNWVIGLQSARCIAAKDVNFWAFEEGDLRHRQNIGNYPPCFVIRVCGTRAQNPAILKVSFSGACDVIETEIVLEPSTGLRQWKPRCRGSTNQIRVDHMIKSLSADDQPYWQESPSDIQLEQLCQVIMNELEDDWEILQPFLGIPRCDIAEIKHRYPTLWGKVYQLLTIWRDKEESHSREKLLRCLLVADVQKLRKAVDVLKPKCDTTEDMDLTASPTKRCRQET